MQNPMVGVKLPKQFQSLKLKSDQQIGLQLIRRHVF